MPVETANLRIVTYPAPVLLVKAKPLEKVTNEVREVARRMVELMREAEGIGLAAPQVGLSWRMFVADVPPNDGRSTEADPPTATGGPQFYINPKLSDAQGAAVPWEEGCLSLPDIRGDVIRPPVITITALGLDGKAFTRTAAGLLARCWQHEVDHLDGVLIIQKMTQMSRIKNRVAIKELESE